METTPTALEYEDIRIAVPWGQVSGRWYGDRNVRPILALHGWLDNLGSFETLIPLLPKHVGVLCIDFPGHGQSSKYPKGIRYNVFNYTDIIVRIKMEYNWPKVSLMGHSMGSIVCFIYTCLYPQNVDLIIALDLIKPAYRSLEFNISSLSYSIEKTLIEEDRMDKLDLEEPPSYTYDELERVLYEGSRHSVDIENCKYILNRSIAKSTKYPDKYYFSRDGKVKWYREFLPTHELVMEMAKRIRNIAYIVIRGSNSQYINEDSEEVIELLRKNNAHFEFHTVEGTHHVHLNNAAGVAALLCPFINKYHPAQLSSWTLRDDENGKGAKQKNIVNSTTNVVRKIFRNKL